MTQRETRAIHDLRIGKQVIQVKLIRELWAELKASAATKEGAVPMDELTAEGVLDCCYTAACLYVLHHPDNPHEGDAQVLKLLIELGDARCEQYERAQRAGELIPAAEGGGKFRITAK
jgi:hypothetical protein